MNGNSFLIGVIDAAAFMLSASFLAYVAAIILPLIRHRPASFGNRRNFAWHFFVPCLDEERVIEATVRDLCHKFRSAHVWCIDDASVDGTPHILARLAAEFPRVHVVTRRPPTARQGKGPALNAGWRALVRSLPPETDTDRVIVGVVDADGILDPRCMDIVTGPTYFGNPDVSAVQTMVRVINERGDATAKARLLTRMQDLEFTCVIAAMQMLRRHVGSAGMGGNGQFTRLSALQQVAETYGTPWQKALIEDFELGLHVLLTGGATEYCHDTWVAQQGPPSFGRLVRQRSRWAQGLMQCFRYLWPVLRSPKISTAAALEITYFLFLPWFQLLGGLVYIATMVLLIYGAFAVQGGPLHFLGGGTWGLIPLFIIFGLAPLVAWGPIYRRSVARELGFFRALGLGLLNWPYTYVHHLSTWWAFGRVVRSRHDWKKTERLELRPEPWMAPARSAPSARSAMSPALALAGPAMALTAGVPRLIPTTRRTTITRFPPFTRRVAAGPPASAALQAAPAPAPISAPPAPSPRLAPVPGPALPVLVAATAGRPFRADARPRLSDDVRSFAHPGTARRHLVVAGTLKTPNGDHGLTATDGSVVVSGRLKVRPPQLGDLPGPAANPVTR